MRYLSIILVLLFGCDSLSKVDNRLKIKNDSKVKLHFLLSISYPDTLNFVPTYCSLLDIAHDVDPYSQNTITSRRRWEDALAVNPQSTYMIYIYNKDSAQYYFNLTGNKCDSLIKRKDLILKRVDFTLAFLKSNNWTITYPWTCLKNIGITASKTFARINELQVFNHRGCRFTSLSSGGKIYSRAMQKKVNIKTRKNLTRFRTCYPPKPLPQLTACKTAMPAVSKGWTI